MSNHRTMIESLEDRRLLSSVILYTTGTAAGELFVKGNPNLPNNITIQMANLATQLKVVINNNKTKLFPRTAVGAIFLIGGNKNDVISVLDVNRNFANTPVHIFGRDGNDTLTGGSGNDTIGGEGGNDLIQGGYGDDLISGDAGNDRLYGGFAKPVTGDGNDTLFGGDGNDLMIGGSDFDIMFGEAGNDTMYGGLPNDPTNQFRDASDDMFGGDGNDKMYAGAGRNRMHGMNGNDTLVGGTDNDTLYGGAGHNDVTGGGGHDIGAAQSEWRYLSRFLSKITPLKPVDSGL